MTTVIDVGANKGGWTRQALKRFPEAHFLLVEPQRRLASHWTDLLKLPNVSSVFVGIADIETQLEIALPQRDDSASFREEAKAGVPTELVNVTTLDKLVEEGLGIPDLCKIDAEGFDLKVLAGASKLLGKTDVFLIEAAVCAKFENTVDRVVLFMAEHGYRIFEITDLNQSKRDSALWLVELVFVRVDCEVWEKLVSYE